MNTILEKVLVSGQRVGVDLKRKHSDRSSICHTGDTKVLFPLQSPPGLCIPNIGKRRRLGPSRTGAYPAGKRLLKYYSNFKKSENLQRLMYYENDEWNDFSEAIVTLVNEGMLDKKPAVEVEVDGNRILLDFLHMMKLDMETGLHQPIAWIDVAGNCFFPEIVGTADEHSCHCQYVEGYDQVGTVPQNINLHLEIEIRGLDNESSGESIAVGKQVEANSDTAPEGCDDEINYSCPRAVPVGGDKKCSQGPINGQVNRIDVSRVIPGPEIPETQRTPKSPWMQFPVLFTFIQNKIPPQNMEHVRIYYELFRSKTISRDVFINKLRSIVGDAVLKSAIMSLKREMSESPASAVETS